MKEARGFVPLNGIVLSVLLSGFNLIEKIKF
jgi:hypothetical protein